jgi:hypothetical protein
VRRRNDRAHARLVLGHRRVTDTLGEHYHKERLAEIVYREFQGADYF